MNHPDGLARCHRPECAPALDPGAEHSVRCTHCGLIGYWCTTEQEAVKLWNDEINLRLDVMFRKPD